jgi:hypothetical protein
MIPSYRKWFNGQFSPALYQQYLQALDKAYPGAITFRVAETPVFIDRDFRDKMLDACESIVDFITDPAFRDITEAAIPPALRVPGENSYPHFIAFDFGICLDENGRPEPQLIEMQGFPTLFGFQAHMSDTARSQWHIPAELSSYLNGFNRETYLALLKEIIVGQHAPEEVVLLEILPHEQKTRIDFYCTQEYLGIQPVCITSLIREGKQLFYLNNGRKTKISRIYNRVIFDELLQQPAAIQEKGRWLFGELDVEWIPHPHWFYRISKYTLPFIQHPYVPATFFLNEVKELPAQLSNYVLKPLFSFAGQGVIIDVTPEDVYAVADPHNWILQRKVDYAPIIATPDEPSKAEIRIFYFWQPGAPRPVATHNLARLSKGKMIGVSYNQNKTWVGGTLAFFEQ